MTTDTHGKAGDTASASGPEPSFWRKLFNTTRKKVAWAVGVVGVAALGAIGPWAGNLMYQGTQVDNYRAIADTQQARIDLLDQRVDALDSSNKELASRLAAAQKSLNGVCSAVESAVVSGQLSSSGQLEETCGVVKSPIVTIQRPHAGDEVPMVTEASGTADVEQLNGRAIWFAVSTPGIPGFFIQGDWSAKSGPSGVTEGGTWTSPTLNVGNARDAGRAFDIVVILADKSAADEFWAYLQQGHNTGNFPAMQLPAGAQEYMRIDVIRK